MPVLEIPSAPIDPQPPHEQPTQLPGDADVPGPPDAPGGPLEPVPDPGPADVPDPSRENPELPV